MSARPKGVFCLLFDATKRRCPAAVQAATLTWSYTATNHRYALVRQKRWTPTRWGVRLLAETRVFRSGCEPLGPERLKSAPAGRKGKPECRCCQRPSHVIAKVARGLGIRGGCERAPGSDARGRRNREGVWAGARGRRLPSRRGATCGGGGRPSQGVRGDARGRRAASPRPSARRHPSRREAARPRRAQREGEGKSPPPFSRRPPGAPLSAASGGKKVRI